MQNAERINNMSLRSITILVCALALAHSWSDNARADDKSRSVTGAVHSSTHRPRFQAIVNGHNLQPRDDQLRSLHIKDLTPQESRMIDRLYQRLLAQNSRSPYFSSSADGLVGENVHGDPAGIGIAQAEDVERELDGRLNICRGC
jgi:hypothetical protein